MQDRFQPIAWEALVTSEQGVAVFSAEESTSRSLCPFSLLLPHGMTSRWALF